ncbi:MAG: hypothetical protein DRN95_07835 [Candidatus Hydrothermarchaeota archaeon]|nr:MAG: hypothetical protein DRN95_07835 [Candidatus Hydrothermarchaeota archaeon]
MEGLTFEIEGINFTCFRRAASTSVILTYPIPPFTTIRGLIASCLGLPRFPDYDAQLVLQNLKIGIQPLNLREIEKNKTVEICRLLKMIEREAAVRPKLYSFPSAPLFKEFLVNPKYKIYLCGGGLIRKIYEKLQDPERPLYIGQSDDMVDTLRLNLLETKETYSNQIHSVLKGIYERCEVVKIPYKFSEDGKNLEEITVSIPQSFPIFLDKEIKCYQFDSEYVCVY